MKLSCVLVVLTLWALALPAQQPETVTPAEVKWSDGPPSLPKGVKIAVLEGDMRQEGIFTARLKLPAGFRLLPHWHPVFEYLTVLEGTYSVGRGEKFDQSALRELPAGSFSVMPPKTPHFGFSKQGAIVQITAMGPWDLIYLDPEEGPRARE